MLTIAASKLFPGTPLTVDASDAALAAASETEKIPPYRSRVGHPRPLVTVIGENGGTEVTDYVIQQSQLTVDLKDARTARRPERLNVPIGPVRNRVLD